MRVSVGAGVQSRVRVGAVSVPAPQRAEDHGAACDGAAVFDLQVDGVVVDLQSSCANTDDVELVWYRRVLFHTSLLMVNSPICGDHFIL